MLAPMRPYDLIIFDVDGTLMHHPEGLVIWEVLNDRFIGDRRLNRERYRRYRAGEISYAEWVDLDVGGWQRAGATRADVIEAIRDLAPAPGAHESFALLQERGYRLAVVSGTIDVGLNHVFPEHPFEAVFTNHLEFAADGTISGWRATPYDLDGKVRAMEALVRRFATSAERCAFVGDAFNDVPIARAAGFSIAFNSRCEELMAVADAVVPGPDLRGILPYFLD